MIEPPSRYLSDQELALLVMPRPNHAHAFGPWFRAEPWPGAMSNRYQRRCKCGHIEYGRGDQRGENIRMERREIDAEG